MCGIIGFVASKGLPKGIASRIILNGYIAQKERGNQSFGALINSATGSRIIKSIQLATFMKNFTKLDNNTSLVMFHHRMASIGNISKQNTHPFVAGNICLVHNGTWVGASLHKSEFLTEGDTDSEIIAHMINKYGVKDAVKNISGSASLVWVNKEEETINFWRLSTPMVIAYVPSWNILFFASTEKAIREMVSSLGLRNVGGVFPPYYKIDTEEEYLYQLKLKNMSLPHRFKLLKSEKYESFKSRKIYYHPGYLDDSRFSYLNQTQQQHLDLFEEEEDYDDSYDSLVGRK
jgi:glucosamine 6-phosphate synthetase-like amidotransferase/phosphosugar isomerase protein